VLSGFLQFGKESGQEFGPNFNLEAGAPGLSATVGIEKDWRWN
jgi:hypothetical protein